MGPCSKCGQWNQCRCTSYSDPQPEDTGPEYEGKFVLYIAFGGNRGVLCNDGSQAISLDPEEVKQFDDICSIIEYVKADVNLSGMKKAWGYEVGVLDKKGHGHYVMDLKVDPSKKAKKILGRNGF